MVKHRIQNTSLKAQRGKAQAAKPRTQHPEASGLPELARPRWLAGTMLAALCLASLSLYGAICLLFWQGQWQMVFGPSQGIAATPAAAGLNYDNIRFDATETGTLRLDGWWIPAEPGAHYAGDTILFLRDGSGSLSDSVAQLKALHALGINLFAFDYRGFGASAKIHPSERSATEDAEAAWAYLTGTRHLAPTTIVIYGQGLGAAIAAQTVLRHPSAPALVLEDLRPPTLQILKQHRDAKFLPVRLIFHDRFDPTKTLDRLSTPKLFLSRNQPPLYYSKAAEPKSSAVLAASGGAIDRDPAYLSTLSRFLGEYLPPHSN